MRHVLALISVAALSTGCGANAPVAVITAPAAPPEPAHEPEAQPEPSPPVDPVEAWLETVEVQVELPTEPMAIPDGYRARSGDGVMTWTSPDQRSVIVRHPHDVVVRATLAGPPPPEPLDLRLVPVLHGGRWPHFALLVDGSDVAIPLSSHGALPFRPALRRAARESDIDDGEALEQTARLVHDSECEGEEAGCMYYGTGAELQQRRGGDLPGGWLLYSEDATPSTPGVTMTQPMPYEEEPGPLGLSIQTPDEESWDVELARTRIYLRRGRRLTHAFDLATTSFIDAYAGHEGRVIEVDGVLLVWFSVQGWQHAFSRHDPRTGRRIGEPVRIGITPQYGEAHGQAPELHPVMDEGELRFALILFGRADALLFDHPGATGRFVPISFGPERELDEDGRLDRPIVSPFLRLERCGAIPCLRDPGAPEATSE